MSIPKPTAAELELLQTLWPLGAGTAKQVHEAMLAGKPDLAYGTVLRLMQIMHTKGILTRDESQRSHIYAPAQPQDALQGNLLQDLMQKAFAVRPRHWCWRRYATASRKKSAPKSSSY